MLNARINAYSNTINTLASVGVATTTGVATAATAAVTATGTGAAIMI
jgi:hypothetical protein